MQSLQTYKPLDVLLLVLLAQSGAIAGYLLHHLLFTALYRYLCVLQAYHCLVVRNYHNLGVMLSVQVLSVL